jgi:hypothetical protein
MVTALAMAAAVSLPLPAPGQFVTEQYGLTFETPARSSYCALPKDWVGSDHGTVIFLVPPKRCLGAGYPSSGRGFDGDVPRIEVFYGYSTRDDAVDQAPPPCARIGSAEFLGKARPLCRIHVQGRKGISAEADYPVENGAANAVLTLVTTPVRLRADLSKFKLLLKSARTCTATWKPDDGGAPFTTGSGPPCPSQARWF